MVFGLPVETFNALWGAFNVGWGFLTIVMVVVAFATIVADHDKERLRVWRIIIACSIIMVLIELVSVYLFNFLPRGG